MKKSKRAAKKVDPYEIRKMVKVLARRLSREEFYKLEEMLDGDPMDPFRRAVTLKVLDLMEEQRKRYSLELNGNED